METEGGELLELYPQTEGVFPALLLNSSHGDLCGVHSLLSVPSSGSFGVVVRW